MSFTGFILAQCLSALSQAAILFFIACGLTLIFGIMGVVNLAHGSFYMLGAYVAYALTSKIGHLFWALPLGAVLGFALGWLLEKTLYRHFYQRDHLDQVLLTFGLIYIFEECRSIIWGDRKSTRLNSSHT